VRSPLVDGSSSSTARTRAFAEDRAKQQQWASFVESIGAERPPLGDIINDLAAFLMPHAGQAQTLQDKPSA
jgi:hypothetical protein